MNSKQLNFFILPEDIAEINVFLKDNGCDILKNNVPSEDMSFGYDLMSCQDDKVFQVYISNDTFDNKIVFKYLESKNYYYIDTLYSNVIQFSLGGFYPYSNKELHRARLYFVTGYYDGEEKIDKDDTFIKWADDIFKSFKKQFLITSPKYPNHYFSSKCLEWVKNNDASLTTDGSKFIV